MSIAKWKLIAAGAALVLSTAVLPGCGGSEDTLADYVQETANQQQQAPVYTYEVINTYPHSTESFTQGLVFFNNRLYESAGLVGDSDLREVDLTTGQILRQVDNPADQFAEGLALRLGRLYQLTLSSGVTNVFDLASFVQQGTIPTRTPAWGLAYIPEADRFVFSDGTSTLRYLLPESFQQTGSVNVTDNGVPVDMLNELEYVNGVILANRFQTNEIVGINPNTGQLIFRLDLTGIIDPVANNLGGNDVLNGIAYDAATDRLFVTGKRWPFLYEIDIVATQP